jgi:leucine-zipper-like transcriptional regulator 1
VVHTAYEFGAMAIDPDGDKLAIRFAWGDGDTSNWSPWVENEEAITMSHSWASYGTYGVKVQAKDTHENTSEWSISHLVKIPGPNQPPVPSIPYGPSYANIGQGNNFSGSAIDPDGDSIFIRFDWGNGYISDWSYLMASGDSVLITNTWSEPDSYYVKAQAMDIKGMTSDWSDSVLIMVGEVVWIRYFPPWQARESHTAEVFNNKMWLIGGYAHPNEVWSSPDGINWTLETNSAGFGTRDDAQSVVFDNKLWVIGGSHEDPHNDVWCSLNGVNWTCVTDSAPWPGRWDHSVVVFNNKIWVLGGVGLSGRLHDVWFSPDGIKWQCATRHAVCVSRSSHGAAVFNNEIWVMGGRVGFEEGTNAVWHSRDGREWFRATGSAPWGKRYDLTSEAYDNKIWVIGGNPSSDVWYSSDGETWFRDATSLSISDHSSIVFNNKIWVFGGGVWCRDIILEHRK